MMKFITLRLRLIWSFSFLLSIFSTQIYAQTLVVSVNSTSDDAEESPSGDIKLNSSDLELIQEVSNQTVGIRFANVNLPKAAIISSAYIQFQVDESSSGAAQLNIRGEANDNPATFSARNNNISSRPLTGTTSIWYPKDWPTVGANDVAQRSSDVSSIIQELIGNTGWNPGQSMAFVITGSGKRVAESFNGSPSGAPALHIEYVTDGNPPPNAIITATPKSGTSSSDVSFDGGSSTDNGSIVRYEWDYGDGSGATDIGPTVNHTYADPGNFTATLTITDDGGKAHSSSQVITVIDPNAPLTLTIPVSHPSDDAEEAATGTVNLNSSDLELTQESSNQTIGIRFTDINLPRTAAINRAYIQFQVDESTSGAAQLSINGESSNNPLTFSSSNHNISSRLLTGASSIWNPEDWPSRGATGADQRSSDISPIIQELIGQSGWNPGQSMAFIITGTGKRTAESFNGSPAGAPTLHIEYTSDGNPSPTAIITVTPNTGTTPLEVGFDGAGSTDNGSIVRYDWNFGDGSGAPNAGSSINHTYTSAGDFSATLTVTDNEGKTHTTHYDINVIDPNAPLSLDIPVNAASDDAEEAATGRVNISSSDLELIRESSNQTVGIRFTNINLPKVAVISRAYIQFQVDETSGSAAQLNIRGEASDDPATFSSSKNNISHRPLTVANTIWNPEDWPAIGASDIAQRSSDISSIIQELSGRNGWNPGQSMAFIITGTGKRTAESFNGSATGAPTLHVEYTTGSNLPPNAVMTATPSNGSTPLEVSFDSTGSSDDGSIVRYDWNFGDGNSASNSSASISHIYTTSGSFSAMLTVTDDKGESSSANQTITVSDPPTFGTIIINEFLAGNSTGLTDGNGEYSDWIELYNPGSEIADISGWCLTDKESNPKQWCFPTSTSLAGGDYQIVFATKNSPSETPAGEFHAQMKLSKGGEYLALLKPDGSVVSSFNFPPQHDNISYGADSSGGLRYFPTPTPNATNGSGVTDLLAFDTDSIALGNITTTQVSLSTFNSGTVSYTLSNDASWLSTTTAAGEDGETSDLINITATIAGLAEGEYTATVTAMANGYLDATLTVTLSVGPAPAGQIFINEILAGNTIGLQDGNGEYSDWIELYNSGSETVDISAWCLTDKESEPQQWCFPAATGLAGGDYLIVFATKNSPAETPAGEYHAQMKLSKGGEYLTLLKPDGSIANGFIPSFPAQQDDISYGRNNAGDLVYFDTPTPGAENGSGTLGNLQFNTSSVTMTGVSSTLIRQVVLGTTNGNTTNYSLEADDNGAGWLSAVTAPGEDGNTTDTIDIRATIGNLAPGSYNGTITANADNHSSASINVTLVVSTAAAFTEWEALDLTLDGVSLVSDSALNRMFYSLGSGYKNLRNHSVAVKYDSGQGYQLSFNNGPIVASDSSYNFGDISYGSYASIQLYKDGFLRLDYQLVFSNLPVIMLKAETITDEPKRPGIFRLTSHEYGQDSGVLNMGIEFRGATSQNYPKKPYGIEFRKLPTEEKSINAQLLNLRKDDDWILDPSYRDTTFVRNLVSHDLWREMRQSAFIDNDGSSRGQPSIKGIITEVIQDNQYQGIHLLEEKLDRKLLDLSKVNVPTDVSGEKRWDQVDFSIPSNGSVLYYAQSNQATMEFPDTISLDFEQKYPKPADIERFGPLEDLISFVVNSSDEEFINSIGHWVDIDNIVDFWLLTGITQSVDTLKKNYFIGKNEDQRFFMTPWDFDATFGMNWKGNAKPGVSWWDSSLNNLIRRLHDLPAIGFNRKVKVRWEELKINLFSENAIMARFETYNAQLHPIPGDSNNPIERNMTRWPGSGAEGSTQPELGTVDYIRDWLQRRIEFLERSILNLPE